MANPFQLLAQTLVDLGFYDFFFPFIITTSLFYALLKKSKIISESNLINATISISLAFIIFGFPILAGITLATEFSTFFTQATIFLLIFFIGILTSSLFYPKLIDMLIQTFTRRTTLFGLIALSIGLFVSSGLVKVFTIGLKPAQPLQPPSPPADLVILASTIIIFVVILILAATIMRREE